MPADANCSPPSPLPAFRFPSLFAAIAVAALALAPAGVVHATFGVRWSQPGQTLLEVGPFTQFQQVEILSADAGGVARVINATTGNVVATLPGTFAVDWQRMIVPFSATSPQGILTWTNPGGGGSQIELYVRNGSAIVRAWSVTRPDAILQVAPVALRYDGEVQICLVTGSGASRGLDILEGITGALRYSLAPATAASTHLDSGAWDSAGSPAVLFATLDGTGKGPYRMIQETGGIVSPTWTYTGRLLASAAIASPTRLDLLMADPGDAGKLLNSATGAEIGTLSGTFSTAGSIPTQLVDIDNDGLHELYQAGSLYDWNGSDVYQRWYYNAPQLGAIDQVGECDVDGDPMTIEVFLRGANSLVILNGLTGVEKFSSDQYGLNHASAMWVHDATPTRVGSELIAYFDGPLPAFAVFGAGTAGGSLSQVYQRSAGELIDLSTHRSFDVLDVLERDASHTTSRLYDLGTGALLTTMPPEFSSDAGASLTVYDANLDNIPDLVQLASPATGTGGVTVFQWNGSAFAPLWQSSQAYSPGAGLEIGFFESPTQLQLVIHGPAGIVLLRGSDGGLVYDSSADGFAVATNIRTGGWVTESGFSGVLFEGSGPSRTAGLYLLFAPFPLAVGGTTPPASLALSATPNPFRGSSGFTFVLPRDGDVDLRIFDASGRQVRTLARGRFTAGPHRAEWDGQDDQGRRVAAGTYWARLGGTAGEASRLVVLLR